MSKKTNLNWGTGIAIAVGIFVVLNIIFIIFAVNQKIDLVTDNYYEKTLKYQEDINRVKNAQDLKEPFLIELADAGIQLQLPEEFINLAVTGSCKLYRPSDKSKDRILTLSFDKEGKMLIPSSNLLPGYWRVFVEWQASGVGYAAEKSLNL